VRHLLDNDSPDPGIGWRCRRFGPMVKFRCRFSERIFGDV